MWQPVSASEPPIPVEPASLRASFPWSALAAVAAAGIALGIVLGYHFGRSAAARSPLTATAPASAEVPPALEPLAADRADTTDVAVEPHAPPDAGESPSGPSASQAVLRTAATSGRIDVRSTPSGALVVVDGRPHGQTPVTLAGLTVGEHTIEVARSGYIPHREAVTLNADRTSRTITVQLREGLPMEGTTAALKAGGSEGSGTGTVYVDSRPQSARVSIDGRFVGTTPLRIASVRSGAHVVRIERQGYGPFSTSIGVQAGEQTRVTAALEER
jgi:hypothetical protein